MHAREIGLNQAKSAYIAEISERTGQRIESGEHLPNRGKVKSYGNTQARSIRGWNELPQLQLIIDRELDLLHLTAICSCVNCLLSIAVESMIMAS